MHKNCNILSYVPIAYLMRCASIKKRVVEQVNNRFICIWISIGAYMS